MLNYLLLKIQIFLLILNETSISSGQLLLVPQDILKSIHLKNLNRLIFPHLNINSIRKKIDLLVTLFNEDIDGFIISETKIDFPFLTAQFHIEGFATPYRLDRDINISDLFLLIRYDVPSSLLNSEVSIEGFLVELKLRKKKWLLCCSYNPYKNQTSNHLKEIERTIDALSSNYDNLLLLGKFNATDKTVIRSQKIQSAKDLIMIKHAKIFSKFTGPWNRVWFSRNVCNCAGSFLQQINTIYYSILKR